MGVIDKNDIRTLEGIKIKEVSALTNQGIAEIFKVLITDLSNDQAMNKEQTRYN